MNTYLPPPIVQDPLPEQVCVRAIITTIHGTWGSNGDLTKKDSQFCTDLLKNCAEPDCTIIRPFRWTGHNKHHDRLIAALDLRELIRENLRKYPGSAQHLLCHSHGGTVAAHALSDLKFAESVGAVVTLSTPFIYVVRRPLTPSARSIITGLGPQIIGSLVALVAAIGAVVYWFEVIAPAFNEISHDHYYFYSIFKEYSSAGLILGFLLLLAFYLGHSFKGIAGENFVPFDFTETPSYEGLRKVPTLIVRAHTDEATAALNVLSFASWVTARIWAVLSILDKFVRPKVLTRFGIYLLACYYAQSLIFLTLHLLDVELGDIAFDTLLSIEGAIIIVFVIVGIPFAFVRLSLGPFAILCRLTARACGFVTSLGESLEWSFSVEAYPPNGPWSCYSLPIDQTPPEWKWSLDMNSFMHSWPYHDPRTIEYIANWLNEREKRAREDP